MYNSIYILPLFVFDEILRTNDVTKLECENPSEVWVDILLEYDKLVSNYESKKQYRDRIEMLNLELKLKTLKNIYFILQMNPTDEQLEAIERIKKNYGITNLKQGISATETLLAIRRKEEKNKGKAQRKSLDWQIARVSKFLGYRVNKFEITVSEWVETLNMVDEQIKEQQKWQKE